MTTHFGRRQGDRDPNIPVWWDRRSRSRGASFGRRWTDFLLRGAAIGAVVCFVPVANANNGTQTLLLNVNGNIYPTPAWQANGSIATVAIYTFNTFVGSGTITSQPTTLYILNASVLGGDSVVFTPPTGCKVGSQSVSAAFIENGNIYTTLGSISTYTDFTTGLGVSTSIQLSGVAAPGVISGCSGASLAYVY